jgi:plasmid stabilization system protein ParE
MPEQYVVHILPEASSDLIDIFDFIKQDSPQNADSMIRQLFEAIDSLDRFPHRSRVHLSAKTPSRIVHSMTVAPFLIYYRILEAERAVEVLTIRHGARKQPRKFKRRQP